MAGKFKKGVVSGAPWILLLCWVGCETRLPRPGSGRQFSQETSPPATHQGPRAYPYRIVTTCGMVTDIVRAVAGDKAEVVGLLGQGVDPHLYKPTRNDVKELLEADVIFYSGLMLEGRMGDAFSKIGRQGKLVYAVTEEVARSSLREPPEFSGHWDPHVWMDVSLWSECVLLVGKALREFDPANAVYYQKNAAVYREELSALDSYVKEVIASIPEQQRVLITAHDAFGYFSRAYGIRVKSVQGLSTESEPGVEDINSLVDFIVDNNIEAVFVESSVSYKNIQAVIEGAKARGWNVRIGGQLYSDAMGPSETYEGTYVGMINYNATTITRALGGIAPVKGFGGQLEEKSPK